MRILVMATGEFAVPTLDWLLQSRHEVPALLTRPHRGRSTRRSEPDSPAARRARQSHLPILAPATVNDSAVHEQLTALQPELLLVCDYGEILSPGSLSVARLGGINLHGSLLPAYRGAAPVHWAILDGRSVTGVSVIWMTPRLDAGPVLTQRQLAMHPHETTPELEHRLATLGVTAVEDAIELLAAWDGTSSLGQPQDPSQVTSARRLRRDDGVIDWQRSAVEIANQVRGLQPWPGAFTTWHRDAKVCPQLQVLKARVMRDTGVPPRPGAPGEIAVGPHGEFQVATGNGWLELIQVRPQNRSIMAGADFLRGYRLATSERLGHRSTPPE